MANGIAVSLPLTSPAATAAGSRLCSSWVSWAAGAMSCTGTTGRFCTAAASLLQPISAMSGGFPAAAWATTWA